MRFLGLKGRRKEERKCNCFLKKVKKRRSKELWAGQTGFTPNPGRLREKIILENIYIRNKNVIASSQHGLTRRKSGLLNLAAFYKEMTGLVDKERALDTVDLDFSKAFNIVSCNILAD